MSVKNVLNNYSLEVYLPFDTDFTGDPINEGSVEGITYPSKSGGHTFVSNGGPDNQGSTELSWDKNGEIFFRTFQSWEPTFPIFNPLITDRDYSWGIWFKINPITVNAPDNSVRIVRYGGGVNPTMLSVDAVNHYLRIFGNGSGTIYNNIDDGQWHYFAEVVTDNGDGTVNQVRYLDNQIVNPTTGTWGTNLSYSEFGDHFVSGTDVITTNYEISHFYVAPSSVVNVNEIDAVWQAGQAPVAQNATVSATALTASAELILPLASGNASFNQTSATGTALFVDPTIVVTQEVGHVEIVTAILVSSIFPEPTISVTRFINVSLSETLDASAELINNISVVTPLSFDFSAQEATASAEIIQPFIARSPLIASAESGNHIVSVNPNYFNLIKTSNPVFYYNFDATSMNNFGSWENVTYQVGSTVTKNIDSTGEMGLVGAGKSWRMSGNYNNAPNYVYIIPEDADNTIYNIEQSGNFTIDYWFKPEASFSGGIGIRFGSYSTHYDAATDTMLLQINNTLPVWTNSSFIEFDERFIKGPTGAILIGNWNYVAVKVEQNIAYLFINNILAGSLAINLAEYDPINIDEVQIYATQTESVPAGSSGTGVVTEKNLVPGDVLFDEIAIYDTALSSATITNHYGFINALDPNVDFTTDPATANATSGNHLFTVTSNAIPEIKEATASGELVQPTLIAGQSITNIVLPATASSLFVNPLIGYGVTADALEFVAFAEGTEAFALNTTYYDYVQANIGPYRYLTFDSANVLQDYGTDNDYAVPSASFTGQIVTPEFGINGKTAKTAGANYATDAVTMLESEFDDNWSTGTDEYHSAFWIQKSPDDVSTGLRILWNLHGVYDNQHVILYQYQNKLHLQFNNGSGTFIDQATVSNFDVFDGDRHFILIDFDHTGANNFVNLYLDSVDIMQVDLGQYTGETFNSNTPLDPNDPANNFPRLGFGGLITPFASTALPVVPTNYKAYIDEPYWAITTIASAGVINLYNAMPDKTNTEWVVEATIASAEIVAGAISTSSDFNTLAQTASAEITEPIVYTEFEIIINAELAYADAELVNAERSDTVNILSDLMIATAIFNDSGVLITIPGGPMLADATLVEQDWPIIKYSAYIRYVVDNFKISQGHIREVK